MVAVRLKIVPKTPQQKLSEVASDFEVRPSLELIETAMNLVREGSIPKSEWPTVVVLGQFLKLYKTQYGVPYHSTKQNDLREGAVGIEEAIESLGSADVCRCIDVLFGPDMEWAKTKSISMLTKKTNRDRFLIPLMAVAKRKSRGEFSEYTGSRNTEYSVKKL